LNSELSIEVRVPKLFFGEEKRISGLEAGSLMGFDDDDEDDDDDDSDSDHENEGDDADKW